MRLHPQIYLSLKAEGWALGRMEAHLEGPRVGYTQESTVMWDRKSAVTTCNKMETFPAQRRNNLSVLISPSWIDDLHFVLIKFGFLFSMASPKNKEGKLRAESESAAGTVFMVGWAASQVFLALHIRATWSPPPPLAGQFNYVLLCVLPDWI